MLSQCNHKHLLGERSCCLLPMTSLHLKSRSSFATAYSNGLTSTEFTGLNTRPTTQKKLASSWIWPKGVPTRNREVGLPDPFPFLPPCRVAGRLAASQMPCRGFQSTQLSLYLDSSNCPSSYPFRPTGDKGDPLLLTLRYCTTDPHWDG